MPRREASTRAWYVLTVRSAGRNTRTRALWLVTVLHVEIRGGSVVDSKMSTDSPWPHAVLSCCFPEKVASPNMFGK